MKSFTLIEILIYLAIVSAVLMVGTTFIWQVIEGGERASQLEELRTNSNFVLEKISADIKKASSVTTPAPGNSNDCPVGEEDNCLILVQPGSVTVKFYRKTEEKMTKIYRREGTNEGTSLTTDAVQVTDLTISNFSPDKGPGTLRIEMTLQHKKNPRLTFTTNFSVSLRDN